LGNRKNLPQHGKPKPTLSEPSMNLQKIDLRGPVPVAGCSGGRSGNVTMTPSNPSLSVTFTGGDVTGTVGCP
jgi:hypothetical protein